MASLNEFDDELLAAEQENEKKKAWAKYNDKKGSKKKSNAKNSLVRNPTSLEDILEDPMEDAEEGNVDGKSLNENATETKSLKALGKATSKKTGSGGKLKRRPSTANPDESALVLVDKYTSSFNTDYFVNRVLWYIVVIP